MRGIVAAFKIFLFFLSGAVTIAFQSVLMLFTKGPVCLIYPRYYHAFLCWLMGVKVIVEGKIESGADLVYVGNHVSYIDIEAVGSVVHGSFIAKKDVESWPFVGLLGKMQRTVYISRNPSHAAKETDVIHKRLKEGLPVIVFPEGTSSIGTSILPFKSSIFQIFLNQNIKIQPFTINIVSVDGIKADNDEIRDLYAWHGDMTLEPHLWRFAKGKGAVVKITFQEPIAANCYNDRKELSSACHEAVVKGLDLSPAAA